MCIRDSVWRVRDLSLEREVALKMLHPSVAEDEDAVTRFRRCLLYTSDAADERSSVDLGGRRIIKKKTRTERAGGAAVEQTTITQQSYNITNRSKIQRD